MNKKFLIIASLALSPLIYSCKQETTIKEKEPITVETAKETDILNTLTIKNDELKAVAIINKEPHPTVFDEKTHTFYERPGGIAESVLNKYFVKNLDQEYKKVCRIVDSVEINTLFVEKGESEGGMNEVKTLINITQGFKVLNGLDTLEMDEIKEEYVPLKKLMMSLDSIYYDKHNPKFEKLKNIYLRIDQNIKPDNSSEEITSVEDMVAGKAGECSDITATYYTIMEYYNQPIGFRTGKVITSDTSGLHMWLVIKIDGEWRDFDPTWYSGYFVPLDQRKKSNNDVHGIRDKYIKHKTKFETLVKQRKQNPIIKLPPKKATCVTNLNQYISL